jgi:hypothetical protein
MGIDQVFAGTALALWKDSRWRANQNRRIEREARPAQPKEENHMGFYGSEPFDNATATYVWMGLDGPGAFFVEVEGNAPNFTSGITLVRDPHWVGGLKVDVMGWTGPLGQGTRPYTVQNSFPGSFSPTIVVAGSNKQMVVPVKEIPADQADAYLQKRAQAA